MRFIKYTSKTSKLKAKELFENSKLDGLWKEITEKEAGIDHYDLHEGEHFSTFFVLHAFQAEALNKLYIRANLRIVTKDLTEEAIYSFYECNDSDVLEALKFEEFRELVNKYVSKNANMDVVLDKIGRHGLNSLTETDKTFLKQD